MLVVICAGPVQAEPNQLWHSTDWRTIVQRLATQALTLEVLPAIETLRPNSASLVRKLKVSVEHTPVPWYASATSAKGIDEIQVSSGIAFLAVLYSRYAALLALIPSEKRSRCLQYPTHLADSLRSLARSGKTGSADQVRYPEEFCAAPEFSTAWNPDKSSPTEIASSLRGILLFVLAHEVGHHVLGHTRLATSDRAKSRQIEADADVFANELFGLQLARIEVVPFFDVLARIDMKHPFTVDDGYDYSECRILYLAQADLSLRGDVGFNQLMAQRPDVSAAIAVAQKNFETRTRPCELFSIR